MLRLEQKSAEVVDYPICVYIRFHLVLHSLSTDPQMADPVNVWDLPINFFLALEI